MNFSRFVEIAKTIGLIALALTIMVIIIARPLDAKPAQLECRWPQRNEKLIVTINHADSKPFCAYHKTIDWGMAR